MLFPTRSPYFAIGIFIAVLLSAAAGGFYLANTFAPKPNPPIACHFAVKSDSPTPQTLLPATEPNFSPVFKVVEQMPLFPGADCGLIKKYKKRKTCADKALLHYIYSKVKYPKRGREHGVEGMAVVSFVVEKTGAISNIRIVRDPGGGCGEAAADAVRAMQTDNLRWEPGLQKGKPVRVQFNLPVKFQLE